VEGPISADKDITSDSKGKATEVNGIQPSGDVCFHCSLKAGKMI
jgi:hypothetical protein